MKATYRDFLIENPKCGRDLETNTNAQALFDLLSRDRNIIAMVEAADAGKPAISSVVLIIEAFCTRHPSSSFDLAIEQRRTVVGCMIKTILRPFGYEPVRPASRTQKELSRSIGARYFASGSCYVPYAIASMNIVRTVSIEPAVFSLVRELRCPHCRSINDIDLQDEYSSFRETLNGEARYLEVDFDRNCTACDGRFNITGHIIEVPHGEIECEEIQAIPVND